MTTMSHGRDRRLDRIARAREWDVAIAWVDLLLEWALETRRIDLMEAAGVRLHILAAAPTRSEFATGRWAPTPASPDDITAGREFIREVETWDRDQQRSESRR